MKKGDFLVFLIIAVLSVALFLATFFKDDGKSLLVSVDNKPYKTFSLDEDGKHEIKTKKGINILIIENGTAHFENSDCPDKTCEKMGKISNVGESIVCLPHKVLAEVVE